MKDESSIFGAQPERLDRLVFEALQDSGAEEAAAAASLRAVFERPGGQVGRYKLLSVLGEGGMGIVYLAQQEQPIKRRVALKVIKPGMDSKRVIARFEAERQALALLEHPNIAAVYDAGTTEAGRPYFVMEYVRGLSITEHCDRNKLAIEDRLNLFQQVCVAVHHAHQKGIIHRDIKPSNILVLLHEDQVVPKIIDFGVAKAIAQPLTEITLTTAESQLLGTPEYMSPEQADTSVEDIDIRSDIYSLGVLLYELLTGTLPFESAMLRKGNLEQMRSVIRQEEPKTPSTRVSSLDAEASTALANSCQSDAATLRRKLRGDLDWITLKAMEKDRMRRYQTAHALAEDIERHVKNEPVSAGRPGAFYRFQKLVRRNQWFFAAVGAVAVVLVLGVIVSTWQAIRATQAEREQSRLREEAVAAQEKETALRRRVQAEAYASDMSLAQQALAIDHFGRAWMLLDAHRPAPGEPDLRGWEWRYLWQQCHSDALTELFRHDRVYSVSYSSDGKLLAVGGGNALRFVEIRDVASGQRIKLLQPDRGYWVAFSPGDDLLATDVNDQICLWRTDTWECVQKLAAGGPPVGIFKFSADGQRLACLSYAKEKGAIVWEVGQERGRWTEVRSIAGVRSFADERLGSLDFSPEGKALVIGDISGRLLAVDLASGETIFDIPKAHPDFISDVAWSPDGSVIASFSGWAKGPIRLWEAVWGRPLGELTGHTAWVRQLLFSADGAWLYSAGTDQTIRIWDVKKQQPLANLRGSTDEVWGLALSPDGATLASASKDGVVGLWNARPRAREDWPRVVELGNQRLGFAFAPNGRVLAVARQGIVALLDLATLEEIEQIRELGNNVSRVAYSPDGSLLVSGGLRERARVWSCTEHRLLHELGSSSRLLHFGADGRSLLSVDAKGNAIWWDTAAWQPSKPFAVSVGGEWRETVSPDNRLLAVNLPAPGGCWLDAATGKHLRTTGADQPWCFVTAIAFSPDGQWLAACNRQGQLHLWHAPSWEEIEAAEKKLGREQSP